jgi:hypothetical protein
MSKAETNGYVSPFIADGSTREATIPENPGFWSAVKIRYRPMSADEESVIHSKLRIAERHGSPASAVAIYAEAFAGTTEAKGNLLDWNLKDENGHKLNVSQQTICRLHPGFFDALMVILIGATKVTPTETEREAEEKNSVAA